jgi:hypothetical protein
VTVVIVVHWRRLSIARLTVLWFGGTTNHSGVSVACLMAWSAETACCTWGGGQLSVSGSVLVTAVALPEWSFAGALSVVVGWGGAVALFFLVVTDEEGLEDGCYDEEEAGISVSCLLDLKGGQ